MEWLSYDGRLGLYLGSRERENFEVRVGPGLLGVNALLYLNVNTTVKMAACPFLLNIEDETSYVRM